MPSQPSKKTKKTSRQSQTLNLNTNSNFKICDDHAAVTDSKIPKKPPSSSLQKSFSENFFYTNPNRPITLSELQTQFPNDRERSRFLWKRRQQLAAPVRVKHFMKLGDSDGCSDSDSIRDRELELAAQGVREGAWRAEMGANYY